MNTAIDSRVAQSAGRRLFTVSEAAKYGGWSTSFVYKAVARGIFPSVRIEGTRSVRIDRQDLDALIERNKVGSLG